jgi:tRNA threonylcarbamoyladenosine biosynthesis protein TsaE
MPSIPKSTFSSRSLADTKKIARHLISAIVSRKKSSGAMVFALSGNLGAGKTTFTKEFLRALGVKQTVISPTFVLAREYTLGAGAYSKAYHIDIYRLSAKEVHVLELKKIFEEKDSLVIIEWAEKIEKMIPKNATWIYFSHGKKSNERRIEIRHG